MLASLDLPVAESEVIPPAREIERSSAWGLQALVRAVSTTDVN